MPTPTLSEVLALDYTGTTPFERGLTAADYLALHREHGREFRYWDARDVPGTNRSGKIFVEAAIGEGERGLFYGSKEQISSEKYGLFPMGSTLFSCLPDVCEIHEGGYLLDASPAQWRTAQATVTRGAGDLDALTQRFVRQIVEVVMNGVAVSLSHVEAVCAQSPDDSETGGVRWLSNAPTSGTKYLVRFKYSPLYICLGESRQGEPTGSDGNRLPQRVLLRQEKQ